MPTFSCTPSDSSSKLSQTPNYPGIATVIHGNGAVAYVMGHVCGGVIGYPITPSTEISELYEAFRAQGGCNVWGQHPFFFEPEGEHSAQSGALGAALTGGKYISNASSSQGILYGLESHYVTVGKKAAGFVLQVAARSVSRHSLNVMAGHDDVYALLGAGYTILFGSNAQEAADLAAIAYKVSANSLIPVANAMDGFTTSHIQTEVALPEPELLKAFLGDPAERIQAPSESQAILYGAKGRVWQLRQFIEKHQSEFWPEQQAALEDWLDETTEDLEQETREELIEQTLDWIPKALRPRWQRVWRNAYPKGTRQRVPALVDINNPGLTGGVQNQPDYQAGIADHRAHFVADVPCFVSQAMAEYESLTGRRYKPLMDYLCDDAERVIIGLGSVTDDAQAVAEYLRSQGEKVGVISVKLLQPFPEAQLVRLLAGKQAITVLERCDETRLTERVSRALIKAQENALAPRHMGVPALDVIPQIYTGIFGLGGHDLQPNHLIAAFANMAQPDGGKSLFYLGSQFYSDKAQGELLTLQERLKQAYPETKLMALKVGENPHLLPAGAMRIRFHSVGGYGTIATGKLLTDILAGVLSMHSKSAPKYGSEKSGAPTNFFITLSPEPIKLTNAELKQVEVVISPDHKVFFHTNPLAGLIKGGTFILQSHHGPEQVWAELPAAARQQIQQNEIRFFVVDAFKVAKQHAPTADLQTRMMGIAFIGALCGHVEQVVSGADEEQLLARIKTLIEKKFGAKGQSVVASNMAVIRDGLEATQEVNYQSLPEPEQESSLLSGISLSANLNQAANQAASCGLFDKAYFDCTMGDHYRDGTIGEAPVMPGSGMFMPAASAVWKEKGLFKLEVPLFDANKCTGCMECSLACPDAALPLAVHDIHQLLRAALEQFSIPPAQKESLVVKLVSLSEQVREAIRQADKNKPFEFSEFVAEVVARLHSESATESGYLNQLAEQLQGLPLARTRPFFDAMEKAVSGTGGLFSVNLDPWKCSGCMECVDVCGPGALEMQRLSQNLTESFRHNFSFYSQLPNTPERFINEECSDEELDAKRLLLDRDNYYAMASGHGACRGCGEVTALRLVTSINRALQQRRQRRHIQELELLLHDLDEKRQQVAADSERAERLRRLMKVLEERLFSFESGPTGQGPASAIIANATGCSSVYASTFPANPYSDPWVNSLFQDSPALAKGLFEGEVATQLEQLKALRIARLELEDQYQAEHHDAYFRTLQWSQLSAQELALLPTVMSVGGDGASYDIGFGALSRLLSTSTPIKVLVLNTGSYSNTGGQASTASYTAQDSDLSRVGQAHAGKQEARKELGLIATFHPKVMVIQTATVMQGHFMSNLMAYLNYQDSPALMDVYTPCLGEQGVGDDASARQARLAVESRMSPLFVHDPRKGTTLAERFSIEGNPDWQQDWTEQSLTYVDDDGITQIKQTPLTPADFAFGEGRFKKHFTPLQQLEQGVVLVDYLALSESQRHDKVPFIWVVDDKRHLKAMQISMAIVRLTEERRTNWRLLQHLCGLQLQEMEQGYQAQLEQLQARYQQLEQEKEQTLDDLASGMADLTLAKGRAEQSIPITMVDSAHDATPKDEEHKGQGASGELPLVAIAESDMVRCSDCKTCYQQLSELFEKTTIVVEGEAKTVGRVKPGALAAQPLTEELIARAARIADECDAEIIQFHAPVEA